MPFEVCSFFQTRFVNTRFMGTSPHGVVNSLTTRLAPADGLKARHKRFLNQIKDSVLFTFTRDVLVPPTKSTGWAFPHATLELWLVSQHTSFEMVVGVQTAAKHERTPQMTQDAHKQIDLGFEENVFPER